MKPLPSQGRLLEILDYNPLTGSLVWKTRPLDTFSNPDRGNSWNSRHAGKAAFTYVTSQGYLRGTIDGVHYQAHRIIWKMVCGYDPIFLDHDDGSRSNNVFGNLQEASKQKNGQNCKKAANNTSGTTGVYPKRSKWRASIKVNGKDKSLGSFATYEEAVSARKAAEVAYGFNPNHGR